MTHSEPSGIRPPHPEHECSTILTLYAKVTERIARTRTQGPIHEHLEAASTLLDDLGRHHVGTNPKTRITLDGPLIEHVLAGTLAAAPGVPGGQALDGDGTHGHTTIVDEYGDPVPHRPDPTGDAALQRDEGAAARHELHKALTVILAHLSHYLDFGAPHAKVIHQQAIVVDRVCSSWLPRRPHDADKPLASDGEPGCEAHAQLRTRKGPEAAHWWEAIAHRWRGGILGEPAALCSACWERAVRTGTKPTGDDVAHYLRAGKWPKVYERKAS